MSKRFKGLICAYCAHAEAITGDHIFAREFFLNTRRANLPQAPTCEDCNNKKSILEHYLTTVLPFGAKHADASANLTSMVPKRLQKNRKLHRDLAEANTGSHIPIEDEKLAQLLCLIARGLNWHHWKVYVHHETHSVRSLTLSPVGVQFFNDCIFTQQAHCRVIENIGHGTFSYEGIQAKDDCALTFWRFSIYGGLSVTSDAFPAPSASQFVAFTCPRQLDAQLCRTLGVTNPLG